MRLDRQVLRWLRARGAVAWILLGYVLVRLGNLRSEAIVAGGDSHVYLAISDTALWDPDFWVGRYPWATPLLWKLLPGSHLPLLGHLALGTVAWAVLAVSVSRLLVSRGLQIAGLVAVLAFSLVVQVTTWDPMLLSESLSISLFALVVAAWLTIHRHISWGTVATLLVLTLLWSFTRDSNAHVALLTVPLIAVWLARSSRRRFPAALLAGTCMIAAASLAAAGHSDRNVASLDHIFVHRLLPDADARADFTRHGLPRLPPRTAPRRELRRASIAYARWLREEGDSEYLRYVVTHPGYSVVDPLERIDSWLSPTDFRVAPARQLLPQPLELLLYPPASSQLYLWFVLVAVGAALVAVRVGPSWRWTVPAALVAISIPAGMLVWLGGDAGLDRHAVSVAIQARLGLLLLTLFVIDRAIAGGLVLRGESREPGQSGRRARRPAISSR